MTFDNQTHLMLYSSLPYANRNRNLKVVSTGSSVDYTATSGNQWGVDLMGDTAPPVTVAEVTPLAPDLTHGSVPSVEVTFSGPINVATLTYERVTLTCQGVPVPLDDTISASSVSDNTYQLNHLEAFTAARGRYVITVNGSGITDSLGRPVAGSASERWNNILPGDQVVYVDVAYLGTHANGALESPFTAVTSAYQAAQDGNTIRIRGGNYAEANLTMSKPLVLQATNGVVNLGAR